MLIACLRRSRRSTSAISTANARAPILAGAPSISTCRCVASISVKRILGAMLSAGIVVSATCAAAAGTAIEYFNPAFGHYFITASPEEAAALDVGAFPGWQRTGETFAVETTAQPGLQPACRFFSGESFAPKSSHVYTPYAAECEHLKRGSVWQFEGIAFQLALPDAIGQCAEGQSRLYRLYNDGMSGAPNHRYTNRDDMFIGLVGQGWVVEGDFITFVFACVPPTPLPPPLTTAEGIWSRGEANGSSVLVVLEDGDTWLYRRVGVFFERVMHGTSTSVSGSFAGELRNYDLLAVRQNTVATAAGTFQPADTLTGSAVGGGEAVDFTAFYDSGYHRSASALIATGSWSMIFGGRRFDRANINVSATGEISGGSTSGCVFTGSLRPRPSGKNIYDLTVTYGGGACALGSGAATGIGLISGLVDTGSFDPPFLALTILAEKNDRTGGLMGEGYRPIPPINWISP